MTSDTTESQAQAVKRKKRIGRITIEYDREEDRLRLSVASPKGDQAVLWMTRRIAERLVPALLERVTAIPSEEVAQQAKGPQQASEAAQVYEQLQARLLQKPSEPVRPGEETAWLLIRKISLATTTNGALAITFTCDDGEQWIQVMSQTKLRQWLQMLHHLFARAQWRKDFWPEWLGRGKRGR